MKIQRFITQACCGKTSVYFKIDKSVSKDFLPLFISNGFSELTNFTQAGILYIEDDYLIATGAFGTDKIQVKCKKSNCQENLNNFENLLNQLG